MKIEENVIALIKFRCGIHYDNPAVNDSIEIEINSCVENLLSAGVPKDKVFEPLALSAITLWCKRSLNGKGESIVSEPSYISITTQLSLSDLQSTAKEKKGDIFD